METDLDILSQPEAADAGAEAQPSPADAAGAETKSADAGAAEAAATPPAETFDPDYPAEDGVVEAAAKPVAAPDGKPQEQASADATAPESGARFGAPALTRLLQSNETLQQAVQADPRLRGQLYQMARRSGELNEFQAVVPTIQAARDAVQAASALADFDRHYFGAQPGEFLRRLYEAQAPNGQSSGHYERVMQFAHGLLFDQLEQRARDTQDERLGEAIAAIREALPWARRGDAGATHQDLAPEVRAEIERGRAAQQQLQSARAQGAQERANAQEAWLDETAAAAAQQMQQVIAAALAKTAFSEFEREAIIERTLDALEKMASEDPAHLASLDEVFAAQGATPGARQQMVAQATAWAKMSLRDAMEPVVRKANDSRKARAAAADARRSEWRTEPRGAGDAGGTSRPNGQELVAALRQKLGRKPTDLDILNAE